MPELENTKYESFCREYVIDRNATQAAIRAGYSKKTANVKGSQLLAIVSIKERVDDLTADSFRRNEIDADMVLARLWDEASSAPTDGTRVRALELVGKNFGMFVERYRNEDKQKVSDEELAQGMADAYPSMSKEQFMEMLTGKNPVH